MASASLSAEMRSDTGKGVARKLRAAGRVPGVVYGHAREAQSLSVNARDLDKLLSSISTGSTVVELGLGGATTKTLIREIQRHPFKKVVLHIDFQELVAGEKVTVDIPLVYVGIPEGVRLSGALLEQIMHSISVLADPSSIPNHIDVDVATSRWDTRSTSATSCSPRASKSCRTRTRRCAPSSRRAPWSKRPPRARASPSRSSSRRARSKRKRSSLSPSETLQFATGWQHSRDGFAPPGRSRCRFTTPRGTRQR